MLECCVRRALKNLSLCLRLHCFKWETVKNGQDQESSVLLGCSGTGDVVHGMAKYLGNDVAALSNIDRLFHWFECLEKGMCFVWTVLDLVGYNKKP